jgi:hypothetical protein
MDQYITWIVIAVLCVVLVVATSNKNKSPNGNHTNANAKVTPVPKYKKPEALRQVKDSLPHSSYDDLDGFEPDGLSCYAKVGDKFTLQ